MSETFIEFVDRMHDESCRYKAELDQAIRERDETREHNRILLASLGKTEMERDQAIRERDEARATLNGADAEVLTLRQINTLRNEERDDARVVARQFRARRKRGAPWSTTIDVEDCRNNPWLNEDEAVE